MNHTRRVAVVVALVGCAGSAVALPRFQSGEDLPRLRHAAPVAQTLEQIGARAERTRVVVELEANPDDATRAALAAAGVRLLEPLGDGAFFATVERATLRSRLATQAVGFRAVHEVRPTWKMHRALLAGEPTPRHAVVAERVDGSELISPANPVIGAYVLFHPDVSVDAEIEALIAARGGVVRDWLMSVNGLVIEIPLEGARALAGEDAVQWVEPALPRLGETNADARLRTQADVAQAAPWGLDGSGVTAFVYDGGRMFTGHPDFQGRASVLAVDTSSTSDHATHVGGTIGSLGTHSGMAPGVTILSAGFQYDGSGIFLYTNPGDFEADYSNAIALGADLSNNSIGTNTAPNGFDCEITGDYGVMSSVIDATVRGALGGDIVVFWANGNERQTTRCGSTYATTAPPAGAKNHITVGALNSNDDSVTSFTSWGPVDDGRIKPDISAPGCASIGDLGITSTSSAGGYNVKCGTSMASPAAAGNGALFIEEWRALNPSAGDPWNSTVKAFFAHNAADIQNPGPDYQTGYGSIRIVDTLEHLQTGRWVQGSVGNAGAVAYRVAVNAGDTLKLTLAWDDVPGVPNTTKALVNDLDLRVFDPNGNRVFPWTLNPASPGAPAVQTVEDRVNNIEQVYSGSASGGVYTIEVSGFDVPQGPQEFSLVSSHDLLDSLALSITSAIPPLVAPGTTLAVEVAVDPFDETVVPGSERLHYRLAGAGAFTEVALTPTGTNTYAANLPAAACGSDVEFFVSVEGSASGVKFQPADGPAAPAVFGVGEILTPFADDLESGVAGWLVGAPGDAATTGTWEWGDPQGTSAQPEDAVSGSNCWATGLAAGSSLGSFDIDGGATTLTTPVISTGGVDQPQVTYYRWFSNNTGAAAGEDVFVVQISTNGSSWLPVETVGPSGVGTTGGWFSHTFDLFAAAGGPTETFQLRFIAGDLGAGSLVEAAVDDISVSAFVCEDINTGCSPADVTTTGTSSGTPDGVVDVSDFSYYLTLWAATDSGADVTTTGTSNGTPDGVVDVSDYSYYLTLWAAGCP